VPAADGQRGLASFQGLALYMFLEEFGLMNYSVFHDGNPLLPHIFLTDSVPSCLSPCHWLSPHFLPQQVLLLSHRSECKNCWHVGQSTPRTCRGLLPPTCHQNTNSAPRLISMCPFHIPSIRCCPTSGMRPALPSDDCADLSAAAYE